MPHSIESFGNVQKQASDNFHLVDISCKVAKKLKQGSMSSALSLEAILSREESLPHSYKWTFPKPY